MIKITLEEEELQYLRNFVKKGNRDARELTRARILLLANKNRSDADIVEILDVGRNTAGRVKKRYVDEGLQNALEDKPRTGQPAKYTEKQNIEIIAKACTMPPEGRKKWTLVLLTEEMRKREEFKTINKESIRLILKKAKLNLG